MNIRLIYTIRCSIPSPFTWIRTLPNVIPLVALDCKAISEVGACEQRSRGRSGRIQIEFGNVPGPTQSVEYRLQTWHGVGICGCSGIKVPIVTHMRYVSSDFLTIPFSCHLPTMPWAVSSSTGDMRWYLCRTGSGSFNWIRFPIK